MHVWKGQLEDRLSMAAAEKARLERICVNGVTASMKGELISIFLGTIIVSQALKQHSLQKCSY